MALSLDVSATEEDAPDAKRAFVQDNAVPLRASELGISKLTLQFSQSVEEAVAIPTQLLFGWLLRRYTMAFKTVGLINGVLWAAVVAVAASLWFDDWNIGIIIALAIVINMTDHFVDLFLFFVFASVRPREGPHASLSLHLYRPYCLTVLFPIVS